MSNKYVFIVIITFPRVFRYVHNMKAADVVYNRGDLNVMLASEQYQKFFFLFESTPTTHICIVVACRSNITSNSFLY